MGVIFPATEQITMEVFGRLDLNFTANVPIKVPTRVAQMVAVIRGLDDDQITKMVLWQIEHTFNTFL